MTEAELREAVKRKRLMAEVAAKRAAKPVVAAAPAKKEPELPEATSLEEVAHIAKGLPKGIMDATMDLPANLSKLASPAAEWITKNASKIPGTSVLRNTLMALNAPQDVNDPEARLFQPQKAPSSNPDIARVLDPISSREPNVRPNSWADIARTGMEWGSAAPLSVATKAPLAMDAAAAAGAMAGQAAFGEKGQLAGIPAMALAALRGKVKGGGQGRDAALEFIDKNAAEYQPKKAPSPEAWLDDVDPYSPTARAVDAGRASGETGTLADTVGTDQALYDIEAALRNDPIVNRKAGDLEELGKQRLKEVVEAPFGGQVADNSTQKALAKTVAQREAAFNAQRDADQLAVADDALVQQGKINVGQQEAMDAARKAEQDLAAAARLEQEAALPLATNQRVDQASAELQRTYNEPAKAHWDTEVQPKWDEFDNLPEVPLRPVQEAMLEYQQSLTPTQWEDFYDKYGKLFKRFKGEPGKTMLPKDIQTQLLRMKKEITKLTSKGETTVESGQLGDFVDLIEAKMSSAPEWGATRVQPKIGEPMPAVSGYADNSVYGQAKAATRGFHERFNPEKLGDTRQNSFPETFARDIGLADETGAVTARNLNTANVPEGPRALDETLKALKRRKGGWTETDNLQYEAIIDDMLPPEEAAKYKIFPKTVAGREAAEAALKEARAKETTATAAAKSQTERLGKSVDKQNKAAQVAANKKQTALDKTIISKYADNPEQHLKRLLRTSDNIPELTRLKRAAERTGTEGSFKANVRETLALKDWGKDPVKAAKDQKRLVDSGIVTQKEMDYVNDVLSKGATRDKLRSKAIGNFIGIGGKEGSNLKSSIAASIALKGLPVGHSLIVGGAMKRVFQRYFAKGQHKPAALVKLEEYMLDPEKYLAAAKESKTAKEASTAILTEIFGAGQAAELLLGEE